MMARQKLMVILGNGDVEVKGISQIPATPLSHACYIPRLAVKFCDW